MKVCAVTVFESGDLTTSVWEVFDNKEKAEKYGESVRNDETINTDGYYTEVTISGHEVK